MKTLLIVEDGADIGALITFVLGTDERLAIVGVVSSAVDAVAAARDHQPDVVVLDHYIEGDVTGLEAAPALKTAAPASKILLFSDFDFASQAGGEPAIDGFLHKRHFDELLPTVRRLLDLPPLVAPLV